MRRIWCASSWRALAPFCGSMPACADTPFTITSKLPQPLRDVFTAPPGSDGSRTSTASLRRASSSIAPRDVSLPTSSSVVHSMTIRRASGAPVSRSARTASIPIAIPAFMSKMPGPCSRPSSRASGIRPSCPTGQTVSKWPSRSTCDAPQPNSASKWSPRLVRGSGVTRPPIAASRDASSAPHASTAPFSVVGDSRRTSASTVSSSHPC